MQNTSGQLSWSMRYRRRLAFGLLVGLCLCVLITFLLQEFKQFSSRRSCKSNIVHVGIGLRLYHDAFGCFPPSSVQVAQNDLMETNWRPLVWRRFFGGDDLRYREDEPWDSTHNRMLIGEGSTSLEDDPQLSDCRYAVAHLLSLFCCPCSEDFKENFESSYVVVSGEGTAFPLSGQVSVTDISDGAENTIILVESATVKPKWSEPRDLFIENMSFRINDMENASISSHHRGGAWVLFADGVPFFLSDNVEPDVVRALLTIAGGEDVSRDELESEGLLSR